MKNMTLKNITAACHGTFHGDSSFLEKEITGVAIDSRKAAPGFLFVPLKGARVDGHTFIPQVMEQGALATLTEEDPSSLTCPCIHVESCEKALRDIAAFYRMQLDIKVVGITGSVGKTSTKETIASVLSRKYNVLKTEGNFNTESDFRLPSSILPKNMKSLSWRWELTISERCMNLHPSASRISV